jgi:peroxiredoxin
MSECTDLDALVTPYIDEEIPSVDRARLEQHLAQCPPCHARVDAERRVRDRLHECRESFACCAPSTLKDKCMSACGSTAGVAAAPRRGGYRSHHASEGTSGRERDDMKIRWTIAVLGILALTVLTVTTEMPWLLRDEPALVETPVADGAEAGGSAVMLACAADAAPANLAFTLKDIEGKEVSLEQYKGKVILLDFWATWCGPCKVEIPFFIDFQERYGKDGLQVIGVSVDDPLDKLQPYVAEMKMNYQVLQGFGQDALMDAYGPMMAIPVTVLISRDGKICSTHNGLTGKDVFEREIKALL